MNKRIRKKIITRIINGNLFRTGLTKLEQRVWDNFNIWTSRIADPIIEEIKAEHQHRWQVEGD